MAIPVTHTSILFDADFVRREGSRRKQFPVLTMASEIVPPHLDAPIATSDLLQARCASTAQSTEGELAGICAARALEATLPIKFDIHPSRCGVLLAGDFWSYPLGVEKRGGYGDVRPVIDAFADFFSGVLCIPGNHDIYEERPSRSPVCRSWRQGPTLTDCGSVEWQGLRVGLAGGYVGNPKRPFRYENAEQESRLVAAISDRPQILLVHQGPPGSGRSRNGADVVESVLSIVDWPMVVICRHEHWDDRVQVLGNCVVINTHEAVLVIRHPGVLSNE